MRQREDDIHTTYEESVDTVPARTLLGNTHVVSAGVLALGAVVASVLYNGTFTSLSKKTGEVRGTRDTPATYDEPELDTDNKVQSAAEQPVPPTRTELERQYTKTDLLAGDLFGSYLNEKQSNTYSAATNSAIISTALESLTTQSAPVYTKDRLTVVADTTDAAAATYKQAMTKALAPIVAIGEYELHTYARATEKNDPKEFTKLQTQSNIYTNVVAELLKVRVPEGAVHAHLALMNAFGSVAVSLSMMARGYDDIAGSYAAVGTFGAAEKQLDYAYTLHQAYLAAHNVF